MNAIEALVTRKSTARLIEPAPGAEDLGIMMKAAIRAPDHCRLRPWRFLVVEGTAREKLGDIFMDALKSRDPEAAEALLQKEKNKPQRAPMVIVVIAKVEEHPKVPAIEQILSAGAAAQNLMLAAHALGYGGIWRSGKPCFDPNVKRALGAREADQIVGFLYLGTAERPPILSDESPEEYVEMWNG
ncbi:nitroreductase [uncultured Sneathiella sp.]|jgi:nitroreductase|uniref:nitroreductase family protein n=1 Tax=uncultured Sneathiella sp. TaxID=879315 RepID=UPI0030D9D00A|tara:strand:- start:43840 stop:44397 length:558 start_codon:yes stop_codon:yes gene_type:complete